MLCSMLPERYFAFGPSVIHNDGKNMQVVVVHVIFHNKIVLAIMK